MRILMNRNWQLRLSHIYLGMIFRFSNRSYLFCYFLIALIICPSIDVNAQKGLNRLYPILHNYARNLYPDYNSIPEERKRIIEELASYIRGNIQTGVKTELLFVGTNNSTRSQFAYVWAITAAYYYGVKNLSFFSGGTSPSPIDMHTLLALEDAGFIAYKLNQNGETSYEIKYTYNLEPIRIWSKKYNEKGQPTINFASIVVCANADINLPVIKGTNFRTSLHYFDPKAYQNTAEVMDQYKEKCRNVALEMFYLFYLLKET